MYISINDCIFAKSIVTIMNPLFNPTNKVSQFVHNPALSDILSPKIWSYLLKICLNISYSLYTLTNLLL